MIDIKAARAEPGGFQTALGRRGGAEQLDAAPEADARWQRAVEGSTICGGAEGTVEGPVDAGERR
jgi:hypothetical protein